MRDLLIGAEARHACPWKLARLYDYSTGLRAVFMNARCLVRTTPPPRRRGRPLKPPAALGALHEARRRQSCSRHWIRASRACAAREPRGGVEGGRAISPTPPPPAPPLPPSCAPGPSPGQPRKLPGPSPKCEHRTPSVQQVGCLLGWCVVHWSAPQDSPPARGSYQSLRYAPIK